MHVLGACAGGVIVERSDVIDLISTVLTLDDYGVQQKIEISTSVYAQIKSASQSEFFNGGRNGLNPQLVFVIREEEFEDQETALYSNKRYSIYRTFVRNDGYVELYAEYRKGA